MGDRYCDSVALAAPESAINSCWSWVRRGQAGIRRGRLAISRFELEMLVNDLWVRIERNDFRVLPISLVVIHVARALGLAIDVQLCGGTTYIGNPHPGVPGIPMWPDLGKVLRA